MASVAPSSSLLRCLLICLSLAAAAQGSHRHHHGSKSAKGCARCPPEWGVAKLCDAKTESETVCRPCPPGTWTPSHPHLMACRPCSRCGVGLYIHRFCHPTADTECGWCSNPLHDRFTADFLRKCAPRPVPGAQDDPINKLWEERTKAEHPEDRIHPLPSLTHRLWQLKDLRDSAAHSPEVVLKPSYHQYQLENAPESREDGMSGRTKAWVMLSIAGLLLLLVGLISAAVCQHRFGRRPHRLYVALTDADQRIISECAANLDEKDTARRHRFQGQENPLAALLPSLEELPEEEHVDYARTHHRQS